MVKIKLCMQEEMLHIVSP